MLKGRRVFTKNLVKTRSRYALETQKLKRMKTIHLPKHQAIESTFAARSYRVTNPLCQRTLRESAHSSAALATCSRRAALNQSGYRTPRLYYRRARERMRPTGFHKRRRAIQHHEGHFENCDLSRAVANQETQCGYSQLVDHERPSPGEIRSPSTSSRFACIHPCG